MTRKRTHCGFLLGLGLALTPPAAWAAPIQKVLHFTKVGYFEHVGGIRGCTAALNDLATRYGFTVKVSKDWNDLAVLATDPGAYDIVVFDNNTDAGGVTDKENAGQKALKDWLMNKGGRYLGIHSASDHRGQWAWYDTTLYDGIRFANQSDGLFTLYRDTSKAARDNPALRNMFRYAQDSLGLATDSMRFNTEYYHFLDHKNFKITDARGKPGVTGFQELRGTYASPPNSNQLVSWVKPLPNGGRFLYSMLGHENAEWTANEGWLAKMTWAYMKYLMGDFDTPNSAIAPRIRTQGRTLRIGGPEAGRVQVFDIAGRLVASGTGAGFEPTLAKGGVYIVRVDGEKGRVFSKAVALD